jgi:hypothetical protein
MTYASCDRFWQANSSGSEKCSRRQFPGSAPLDCDQSLEGSPILAEIPGRVGRQVQIRARSCGRRTDPSVDSSAKTAPNSRSAAAAPRRNLVYVPIRGNNGTAPPSTGAVAGAICSAAKDVHANAGSDALSCIAIYTAPRDGDGTTAPGGAERRVSRGISQAIRTVVRVRPGPRSTDCMWLRPLVRSAARPVGLGPAESWTEFANSDDGRRDLETEAHSIRGATKVRHRTSNRDSTPALRVGSSSRGLRASNLHPGYRAMPKKATIRAGSGGMGESRCSTKKLQDKRRPSCARGSQAR